jgi:GNAT superfamily N-acetyltransferase
MASVAGARTGAGGFLRASIAQLADRRWLGIALLFLVFLGGTNAVLALTKPADGSSPGIAFALAGLVRVVALIAISVAALRIATDSDRRPWRPDGAFFLYFGISLLAFAAVAVGGLVARELPELQRIIATQVVGLLLIAPLTVWAVAAAVERPLALAPRFRGLGIWLPPFLLWAMLLVLPLAIVHAGTSLHLLKWAERDGFWPLAAADAVISTLLVMLTLALRVTAYRSVARG